MPSVDRAGFEQRLRELQGRARLLRVVEGLAVALMVAGALWFVFGPVAGAIASIASVLAGVGYGAWRAPRAADIALAIERVVPEARNVVVTAEQLLREAHAAPPTEVFDRILAAASRCAHDPRTTQVVAPQRPLGLLAGGVLLVIAGAVAHRAGATSVLQARVAESGIVTVHVTPPEYLGRAEQVLRDPSRLEVMRGSRIVVEVRSTADSLEFRTALAQHHVARASDGRFSERFVADSDGFLAMRSHGGASEFSRLLPIAVLSDSAPRVSISAPGRDLLLPNGNQTVTIAVQATDDIGLRSLTLRFTRVSGSGERFTFTEGEVPLTVTRKNGRAWEGTARWALAPLKLDAGDMVVYRAIAADARPGAAPVESDALIAEVAAPGGVAAAGFALDPEQERYALSQQMVILKTERLLAAKARMQPDSFASAAAEIAMEQRRVRAEFVFMMGGEMEDAPPAGDDASMTDLNEEAEAAGEDELAAGRMVNRGRVALLGSIRNMSRAAAALTAVDVSTALGHEKTALKQLETAFSHSRIILRALADRERLDLTRRLGGTLSDAVGSSRAMSTTALPAAVTEAMSLLRELGRLDPLATGSADALMQLAERALRLGPSDPDLKRAAERWTAAAAAVKRGDATAARVAIDDGSLAVHRVVRRSTAGAMPTTDVETSRIDGSVRDRLGGSRAGSRP